MPPKPKYTKEEIINAAFDLARENGIDSVVARAVGARLGTSASPIFTVFDSMDELKVEVFRKAEQACLDYMDGLFDYEPAFKEFGMRWVRFSIDEPKLYRLVFQHRQAGSSLMSFMRESFGELMERLLDESGRMFSISRSEAEQLVNHLLVYANGIATLCLDDPGLYSREQISSSLSQVCISLAISAKLREGTFVEPQARVMALSAVKGIEPQKKNKE